LKPLVSGILILAILVVGFAEPGLIVHALYSVDLPSNVIFADDMENGQHFFHTRDTSESQSGNSKVSLNSTISFSGSKSMFVEDTVSSTVETAAMSLSTTASIVTLSVWFTYGNNIRSTGGFPNYDFFVQSFDGSNMYNGGILFSPTTGPQAWSYTKLGGGVTLATSVVLAFNDTRVGRPVANWHHVLSTVNIVAHTFESVTIDNATYNENHAPQTTVADNTIGKTGVIRFGVADNTDTNTLPMEINFDDVILYDSSPGQSPVIQFGISLFSSWFVVLVASIAMLYTTSGIGLIRRVWFNKTEGILSSYKTIVITGMIATIGFIVILVVGSLLTQQVCSSIPQGSVRCSY